MKTKVFLYLTLLSLFYPFYVDILSKKIVTKEFRILQRIQFVNQTCHSFFKYRGSLEILIIFHVRDITLNVTLEMYIIILNK